MFLRRAEGLAPGDELLLTEYLGEAERELFRRMDGPDQVHSVGVARRALQSLLSHRDLPAREIVRAALLHDVGKAGAGLGLVFRTAWVLGHRVLPWVLDWMARGGAAARPGTLRHRMFVQLEHARLGAQMLAAVGTEEAVCRLVASTGQRAQPTDPPAVRLLLAADADTVVGPGAE